MSERLRQMTLVLLAMCQSTQAVTLGGIAMLLPLIRQDLGLNFSQTGMIGVASGLTYAIMQIPAGYWCDRIGAKRLFLVGLVGTNVSTLTFSMIDSYAVMLANQVVSGVFRALVFAPGLLLMQAEFPESRRATAGGIFLVGGMASNMLLNLLGPLALPWLGWRGLLATCAISVLVIVLAYALIGRQQVRPSAASAGRADIGRILASPVMWWASTTNFARHAVANSWNYWLTTILVTDKGFSLATAASLVALGAAVTMLSNIAGGYIADRLQRPIAVILTTFAALAVALFGLARAESVAAVVAAVVGVAFFVQFAFGPMFAYPVRILGTGSAGFISGFSNTCANAGGLTGAFAVGLLKDVTGWFASGVDALAGLCLIAIGCTAMLGRAGQAHLARVKEQVKPIAGGT